jgi:hypothetical protein
MTNTNAMIHMCAINKHYKSFENLEKLLQNCTQLHTIVMWKSAYSPHIEMQYECHDSQGINNSTNKTDSNLNQDTMTMTPQTEYLNNTKKISGN